MAKTIRLTDETHQKFIEAKGDASADAYINTLLENSPQKKLDGAKLDAIINGIEDIKLLLEAPEEVISEAVNYDLDKVTEIEMPRSDRVVMHSTPPERYADGSIKVGKKCPICEASYLLLKNNKLYCNTVGCTYFEKIISEGKPSNIEQPKPAGRKTAVGLPSTPVGIQMSCCKSRTTMCKHWVWQTETGDAYVNRLDGEVVEV